MRETRPTIQKQRYACAACLVWLIIPSLFLAAPTHAATVSYYATELLFHEGEYQQAALIAREQFERGVWNELWPELLIRCHLTTGSYEEAREVYETGLKRFGDRIAYRLTGYDVYRHVNLPAEADAQLDKIYQLARTSPWRYSSMRDQITLGRFFRLKGEDSKQILELLYDRVRKQNPKYPEVYLATAELALEKHDYALAAEQAQMATQLQPSNPDAFHLLCLSLRSSNPKEASVALQAALKLNPSHVPSILMQVDQEIDGENYASATRWLEQVLTTNLRQPTAWAYHAILAHLAGHYDGEQRLRDVALSIVENDHEIDHLIGTKLSQKYRFLEGAAYQRRSLLRDPDFVAAKFQLASDLLRLGQEEEGWRLATAVHKQDAYHVEAYNLATLRDRLDQFRTVTSDHFIVRMDATEAIVYGQQVIELLEEAYAALGPKYEVSLDAPVHVEIFTRQQDFAIRTFGLPGGAGYLGVCFGPLITANSPVAQGATPTNWKSVLWHEFCHVVTLQKTHNRMPRWLSEGISVYEERQRNAAWGQDMTPRFREMILSDDLTPVSDLSAAFLRPESPEHLQFAYYESSLVVEFLLSEIGMPILIQVLEDLGAGLPINISLERYLGPVAIVDEKFKEFAQQRARDFGANLDWQKDLVPAEASLDDRQAMLKLHANNYWLATSVVSDLVAQENWQAAQTVLEDLRNTQAGDDGSTERLLPLLARTYRELGVPKQEEECLQSYAQHDADSIPTFQRLVELAEQRGDWAMVATNVERILAVNPMLPSAQTSLVKVGVATNEPLSVVRGQTALLQMDPPDPAAANFRLAKALADLGQRDTAKRHVLMALEDAPRYREAHRLLLQLVATDTSEPKSTDSNVQSGEVISKVKVNNDAKFDAEMEHRR